MRPPARSSGPCAQCTVRSAISLTRPVHSPVSQADGKWASGRCLGSSWTRSKHVHRRTLSSTCRRPADPASRLSHPRLPGRVGSHAAAARAAIEYPRSTLTGIHSSASSMAAAVPSSLTAAAAVAALKEAPAAPNAVRSRLGSSSAGRREAAVERAAGGGDAAEGGAECGGACEPAVQLLRGRARASLSVQVACRRPSCCVPAVVE